MGDDSRKKKLRSRVNRIAGQVAGIQKMVEEDRYCVDILAQIAAIRSALDALGIELVSRHVETCVIGHGSGSEHESARPLTKDQLLAELQTVLTRFLR
jgi:CsoR family transcriptional regulator, copper-sensing transcriptional repressor